MKKKLWVITALMMTTTTMMTAQNTPTTKPLFAFEDLIPGGSTYYTHSYPKTLYLTWWGDQCVERNLEECSLIDNVMGDRKPLFTLSAVNASLTDTQVPYLYLVEFPYPDQPLVLLETPKGRRLWNWETKQVVWSQNGPEGDVTQDWSKDSRHLAYVKDHNLYVVTADGQDMAVSTDGNLDLVYGESVHREEFGISKGTFWSPDGQKLAFYRMDQSMVTSYPQVNIKTDELDATTSRIAVMEPDKYPMAGETSHQVKVGIFDVNSQKTIYLDTPQGSLSGDSVATSTPIYFTNISWAPDGKMLYLIELNRDQNHARLKAYDAATGKFLATLLEEKSDKYVEPMHPIVFLPWDQTKFIYQTRNRDGYNHLYLCTLPDGFPVKPAVNIKPLTCGSFEVLSFEGFNKEKKTILFTSNEADPIGCSVYSVDLKGKRTRLNAQADGWHNVQFAESGAAFFDSWASGNDFENGRLIDVYPASGNSATKGKAPLRLLTARDPWQDFQVPEIKTGTIKAADGVTDLYYRLVLPTNFNPSKKYPTVIYVYGGPHAHLVDAGRHWGVGGWDVWMAQQGYVMFTLDNRGSEHRGLAFEQATFRQLGVEEMKDQLCGVDFLKSLPYVDADRLGVHGWSFGGFMTTSLMTTYPDVFKVGVAGGPVIDWRYYEVMYGERYMDTPQTNPEGYNSTSLLGKAANLKGHLLVIYGGNDPTCVPQHTLSFIRACIDGGTYPDLFTYPGDGHNMQGTDRVHLYRKISQYFDDFLKNK